MKLLRKLLASPQLMNKIAWEMGKQVSDETINELHKLVKQANYIVINSLAIAKRVKSDGLNKTYAELPLSPPFKVTWIEAWTDDNQVSPLMFKQVVRKLDGKEFTANIGLLGALINEISPGCFDVFAVEMIQNSPIRNYSLNQGLGLSISIFRNITSDINTPHWETAAVLRYWFDAIQNQTSCLELTSEVINIPRIDRPSKTKPHIINKIIRIVPKRLKNTDIEPITSRGKIDWTHRWEVRGHWRKTNMIGKNREGEYCIDGFTWVKEHKKGPEEATLIKKLRVVSNKE